MRKHNSWVRDSEMGNAQEAIEEYEERTSNARRMDIAKIITLTDKTITMILDHEYLDNGDVKYLIQRHDGLQKWIKPQAEYCFTWVELLKEYWANQADTQNETPDDKP